VEVLVENAYTDRALRSGELLSQIIDTDGFSDMYVSWACQTWGYNVSKHCNETTAGLDRADDDMVLSQYSGPLYVSGYFNGNTIWNFLNEVVVNREWEKWGAEEFLLIGFLYAVTPIAASCAGAKQIIEIWNIYTGSDENNNKGGIGF